MGLFGDKKLKVLKERLQSGYLSLAIGAKMGKGKETLNKVASEIHAAASVLSSEGRAAEARDAISAARRPVADEADTVWNEMLELILSEVQGGPR